MKYLLFFSIFFVYPLVCMEKLFFRLSPKQERKVSLVKGSEEKIIVNTLPTLAVDKIIIDTANTEGVVRFEKSSDLEYLINELKKKLSREINGKEREQEKREHLKKLSEIYERMRGSIATVSPQEVARLFMPNLLYIPPKKINGTNGFALNVLNNMEFDTSNSVRLLVNNKKKTFSGPFAQCVLGLYGLQKLKQLGIILDVDGNYQCLNQNNNVNVLVASQLNIVVRKLLTMCHHPCSKKLANGKNG